VGQVTRTALEPGGQAVAVEAFVDAPYDVQINSNTRFWNASGVDVTVDLRGLRIDTQSFTSILAGGIAFETPPRVAPIAPSDSPGDVFQVFASRDAAFRGAITSLDDYRLVFERPIQGLVSGAPVELFGWEVGEVRDVEVELDGTTGDPRTIVVINLRPDRFAVRTPGLAGASSSVVEPTSDAGMRRVLARLVNRGLRAEVRTGNILTNQRYVALERVRGAGPSRVDWTAAPVTLPTSGAPPGGLAESIEQLVSTLDKLPLDRLTREATSTATELRRTLENTSTLLAQVDGDLVPRLDTLLAESQKTLGAVERTLADDSPLQRDVQGALRELAGAGQAVRVLAQSLDEHPESLVWGKKKARK
jgi:paraquat-inducible protein B